MSRAELVLKDAATRAIAKAWVAGAKTGSRVSFKGPRRSNDQNALLWLWLTAIAVQLRWHGGKYTPDDWKDYFMHALRREQRWMPDENGDFTVPIGMSTSDLSTEEFSDLLEVILAFAARYGVEVDPVEAARITSSAAKDPSAPKKPLGVAAA